MDEEIVYNSDVYNSDRITIPPVYRPCNQTSESQQNKRKNLSTCALYYNNKLCCNNRSNYSILCNKHLGECQDIVFDNTVYGIKTDLYLQTSNRAICRGVKCGKTFSRKDLKSLKVHEEKCPKLKHYVCRSEVHHDSSLICFTRDEMIRIVVKEKLHRIIVNTTKTNETTNNRKRKLIIGHPQYNHPTEEKWNGIQFWSNRADLMGILCTDASTMPNMVVLELEGRSYNTVCHFSSEMARLIDDLTYKGKQKILPVSFTIRLNFPTSPSDHAYKESTSARLIGEFIIEDLVKLGGVIKEYQDLYLRNRSASKPLCLVIPTLSSMLKKEQLEHFLEPVQKIFSDIQDSRHKLNKSLLCTGIYTSARVSYRSQYIIPMMNCYYNYGLGSSNGSTNFRRVDFIKLTESNPRKMMFIIDPVM
jgi:hypothetical protein